MIDDGSCEYESCAGCTDPSAWNWDPTATIDDGSCEEIIAPSFGCTDPSAFNWDPNAEEDDGSCEYGIQGCTDPTSWNYDPMANEDDGSCEPLSVEGCADWNACNPSPYINYCCTVVIDDGSCEYTSCVGCTDPEACNYSADATSDDGSCIPSGCMNESACNFNQYAGCDDASCAFDEDLLDCEAFGFEVDSLVVCLGEEIELVAPVGNGTTPLTGDGAVVDEFYLDFGGQAVTRWAINPKAHIKSLFLALGVEAAVGMEAYFGCGLLVQPPLRRWHLTARWKQFHNQRVLSSGQQLM